MYLYDLLIMIKGIWNNIIQIKGGMGHAFYSGLDCGDLELRLLFDETNSPLKL